MSQKQIKKLLRSKGYSFNFIHFPFGSKGNNSVFYIFNCESSETLYFHLVLEDSEDSDDYDFQYLLFELSFDDYRFWYNVFANDFPIL